MGTCSSDARIISPRSVVRGHEKRSRTDTVRTTMKSYRITATVRLIGATKRNNYKPAYDKRQLAVGSIH